MCYEPLFPAGIHPLDQVEISNHFASKFPKSKTRPNLIEGLGKLITKLKEFNIPFEMWLDGSFATQKEDPNDVDLTVFCSTSQVNALDDLQQARFRAIFNDRTTTKKIYGCDVFFAPEEDPRWRSYWRGWYGFDRNEKPKGIASLLVTP